MVLALCTFCTNVPLKKKFLFCSIKLACYWWFLNSQNYEQFQHYRNYSLESNSTLGDYAKILNLKTILGSSEMQLSEQITRVFLNVNRLSFPIVSVHFSFVLRAKSFSQLCFFSEVISHFIFGLHGLVNFKMLRYPYRHHTNIISNTSDVWANATCALLCMKWLIVSWKKTFNKILV